MKNKLNPDLSQIHQPSELERLRAETEALQQKLNSPRAKRLADFIAKDMQVRKVNLNGETYISKSDFIAVLAAKATNAPSEEVKKFINSLILELNL